VLHGPGGEDGSVQGLLEVLDVPYAGSDVEAIAFAWNAAILMGVGLLLGLFGSGLTIRRFLKI